jgi:hypothetical protein
LCDISCFSASAAPSWRVLTVSTFGLAAFGAAVPAIAILVAPFANQTMPDFTAFPARIARAVNRKCDK